MEFELMFMVLFTLWAAVVVTLVWLYVSDRRPPAAVVDGPPAEGDKWTLRGQLNAGVVTVQVACAGRVFFAYDGAGTRSLPTDDFVSLYRRAA